MIKKSVARKVIKKTCPSGIELMSSCIVLFRYKYEPQWVKRRGKGRGFASTISIVSITNLLLIKGTIKKTATTPKITN